VVVVSPCWRPRQQGLFIQGCQIENILLVGTKGDLLDSKFEVFFLTLAIVLL
jgi:hypothetical protein